MTTGWGAGGRWEAPAAAWALARDTAAGHGDAASGIPLQARPGVIVALGAQIRAAQGYAALHGAIRHPDPMAWKLAVPHAPHAYARELAAAALGGRPVQIPPRVCEQCSAAVLQHMARELLDTLTAAGIAPDEQAAVLDRRAAQAR